MERRIEVLVGAVRVSLENGERPEDIIPVLLSAAETARATRQNLLVVSGFGDPASAEAVSTALEQIHALGVPLPSKIAFVAVTLPQYSIYHFAERYAQRFGIAAKVLVSDRDAKEWLGATEPSPCLSVPIAATREGNYPAALMGSRRSVSRLTTE